MRRAAAPVLREALRRARLEAAERAQSMVDLRDAEVARLELLKEALEPVLRDVPDNVDLFDLALAPGDPPRLFVDIVAFVMMDRDRRTYRLMRDARSGRQVLAEHPDIQSMVEAVATYVARRLVEREQVLVEERRDAPKSAAPLEPPPPAKRRPGRLAAPVAFLLGVLIGALLGAGGLLAYRGDPLISQWVGRLGG